MSGLLTISRLIDTINIKIGRYLAWAILLAVVISAANAIVRKAFNMSSNSLLEIQWVLFGVVFLMCAPWTLIVNEHIRIDIVTSNFSKRVRDWIDVFGHVFFLLPFCAVIIITSIPFAVRSFAINEQSLNAGGLPQWPAKLLIPIGFVLLFIQGVSELIKRIAIIRGLLEDTSSGGGHHAAAEAEAERLLQLAKLQTDTIAR